MNFLDELKKQRWDDHRYYHHSRINQSLHLLSALSFLSAYVMLFFNPVAAAYLGWLVAMVSRQVGHFFFEPTGYDHVNHATHEHKEEIKVGYNLYRKVILLSLWAVSPLALYVNPSLSGLIQPHADLDGFIVNVAYSWLILGGSALLFRTVHLFFIYDFKVGIVWLTKILTDPFHDVKLYHKSPVYLLSGQLLDPMYHINDMDNEVQSQHS